MGEIHSCLSRLGRRRRAVRAVHAALVHALWVGVVVVVADLLVPSARNPALVAGLGWVAVVTALVFVASAVPLRRVDRQLGLADGLVTWAESPEAVRRQPMYGWLERRLTGRLTALGQPPASALVPRARWRLAATVLLLAVLLRLLATLLPLPEGVLEVALGRPDRPGGSAPGAAAGAGDDGARAPESAAPAPEPDPAPAEPESDPPPDAVPPPDEPRERPGAALPPEPLLDDRPVREDFAVPHFVQDGASRPGRARVAELEVSDGGGARAASRDDGATPDPDPERDATDAYRRALERALRSRHVGPDEQRFVRRWFELLIEGRR